MQRQILAAFLLMFVASVLGEYKNETTQVTINHHGETTDKQHHHNLPATSTLPLLLPPSASTTILINS